MKFVAVTSCPTGIAHTYMAAENLEQTGKDQGHDVQVETQGSAGTIPLSDEVIAAADGVIFAADQPSSSTHTQRALDWTPKHPNLLADLENIQP